MSRTIAHRFRQRSAAGRGSTSRRSDPGPRQSGTVLLEAALAIPIFLTFVFGFVDLGMGVFQTSQASSAAADGARAGIIHYEEADVVGSEDRAAIEEAITARVVSRSAELEWDAWCVDPSDARVTCAEADSSVDRLEVTVSWAFEPVSPVGQALPIDTIIGSATMGLIGTPQGPIVDSSTTIPSTSSTTTTTSLPPPDCQVSGLSVDPVGVGIASSGHLTADVSFSAVTNLDPSCTGLRLVIETGQSIRGGGPSTAELALVQDGTLPSTWRGSIAANAYKWVRGDHRVTVWIGAVPLQPSFTFTVAG